MWLLITNICLSIPCLVSILNAKLSGDRGTNTATRFVRDVRRYSIMNIMQMACVPLTLIYLVIGCICKAPYACLPSAACVVLTFVVKYKSNQSNQRVKDARVVTKTSGRVVGYTAAGAAATVCAATGVGAPAAAAIVGGAAAAGAVTNKCMDEMTDVKGPNIEEKDFAAFNAAASALSGIDIKNPDKFIEAARRAGIDTDGKDLGAVASNVIKFAPKAALDQLPEDMSIEDKAMCIMGGKY